MSRMKDPKKATCCDDYHVDVLCCSACGRCGSHSHASCDGSLPLGFAPMVAPVEVANCNKGDGGGVLCCASCGSCGNHVHARC